MLTLLLSNGNFLSLILFSNGKYPNHHICLKAKNTVNLLYKIDKRFLINNNKGIIKYLGRYLARAPIAKYKISSISHDSVSFFFYDLKLKPSVTMPLSKFITQILIHLPPKNFKMISRFGFYAIRKSQKLTKAIQAFKTSAVLQIFPGMKDRCSRPSVLFIFYTLTLNLLSLL